MKRDRHGLSSSVGGWFKVPNAFVDKQLREIKTHGELAALLAIMRFSDQSGKSHPSINRLAMTLGVDRSSVIRAINRLVSSGRLVREKKGTFTRATEYRLASLGSGVDATSRTHALVACTHKGSGVDATPRIPMINTIIEEEYKGRPEMNEIAWSADNGFSISTEAAEEIKKSFPAVDVPTELHRMDAWLKANPLKARKKNWRRFITNWLLRSNENGNNFQPKATGTTGAASRFAGRHQRDRDLSL